MGRGIVQLFAQSGHRVKFYDASEAAVAAAQSFVTDMFDSKVAKGRISKEEANQATANLIPCTQLGDIVFVELPEEGITVTKDDEIVVIESVKAASDILAPIDGEIVEINQALMDEPSKVNDDPIGDGWFFKIKPSDPSQMDEYMDEDAYLKLIG